MVCKKVTEVLHVKEEPSENLTLGQTKNLNLFALSPHAFTSSLSQSKDILSNVSST
jgi:hypothetical protein